MSSLDEVEAAGRQVIMIERQLSAAVRERDVVVRAAVAGGESQSAVSRAAGISRERVRQIVTTT